MKISKNQLLQAAEKGIISAQQAEQLVQFFASSPQNQPQLSLTNGFYYLGGLLAIGAMTLFMNMGWERFGGEGIVLISLLYGAVGYSLASRFKRRNQPLLTGIFGAFVVCLTPLFVYGLQQCFGLWPSEQTYHDYHRRIEWHWLYMELATMAVGVVLIRHFKTPFMMMPIAVTLWYLSMDLADMLAGGEPDWQLRSTVSMGIGALMLVLALGIEVSSTREKDYSFWLYVFGALAFWGGLSMQQSDSEVAKLGYLLINLVMIAFGVLLKRRVFVVFGALGTAGYVGYLASQVFTDSWLFPIALTVIGGGVIYAGLVWQKNEHRWTQALRAHLPQQWQEVLARLS